jgi:molecular chaperone GrpE
MTSDDNSDQGFPLPEPVPDLPETEGQQAPDAIEQLKRAVESKAAEAQRFQDQYLRVLAESDNLKKRLLREKSEALRFACEGLIRDLIPIIDNLERAVQHAESGSDGQPLVEGVRMVLQGALGVLERHGVTRIEAGGQPFDPSRHEAIARVPSATVEPNRVVEQFLPGYALHGRLLRAAQVGVSAQPSVENPPDDG